MHLPRLQIAKIPIFLSFWWKTQSKTDIFKNRGMQFEGYSKKLSKSYFQNFLRWAIGKQEPKNAKTSLASSSSGVRDRPYLPIKLFACLGPLYHLLELRGHSTLDQKINRFLFFAFFYSSHIQKYPLKRVFKNSKYFGSYSHFSEVGSFLPSYKRKTLNASYSKPRFSNWRARFSQNYWTDFNETGAKRCRIPTI